MYMVANGFDRRGSRAEKHRTEHFGSWAIPDPEVVPGSASRVCIPLFYLLPQLAELPVQFGQPGVDSC